MVITLDSDSSNPGSIPGTTFLSSSLHTAGPVTGGVVDFSPSRVKFVRLQLLALNEGYTDVVAVPNASTDRSFAFW